MCCCFYWNQTVLCNFISSIPHEHKEKRHKPTSKPYMELERYFVCTWNIQWTFHSFICLFTRFFLPSYVVTSRKRLLSRWCYVFRFILWVIYFISIFLISRTFYLLLTWTETFLCLWRNKIPYFVAVNIFSLASRIFTTFYSFNSKLALTSLAKYLLRLNCTSWRAACYKFGLKLSVSYLYKAIRRSFRFDK